MRKSEQRERANERANEELPQPGEAQVAFLTMCREAYAVDSFRYAIRSFRSPSFLSPAKIILVPCERAHRKGRGVGKEEGWSSSPRALPLSPASSAQAVAT